MNKITLVLAATMLPLAFSACNKSEDAPIYLKAAGSFAGKEACGGPAGTLYFVDVYNQADVNNGKVFVHNLYDIGETYEATLNGNVLTLPATPYKYQISATTFANGTISGSGTIDGNILTFSYKLTGDDDSECTFTGDREFRGPVLQN